MKIPEFLIEMSKQMQDEDNRATADPIWMVCHDNWLTCADDRGDKVVFIITDDGEPQECSDESVVCDYFKEHHRDWFDENINENCFDSSDFIFGNLPGNVEVERICMQKEMKVVNSHLTEEGAKQFIARKQHDYPKLDTHVYSMYFCEQIKELRGWIKSLSDVADD